MAKATLLAEKIEQSLGGLAKAERMEIGADARAWLKSDTFADDMARSKLDRYEKLKRKRQDSIDRAKDRERNQERNSNPEVKASHLNREAELRSAFENNEHIKRGDYYRDDETHAFIRKPPEPTAQPAYSIVDEGGEHGLDLTRREQLVNSAKNTVSDTVHSVKSSVNSLKSSVSQKYDQAAEAVNGFKAKYSSTPTEFQQQTTEMVNKFSGGKYTGAVDTENMNWIEAGANKHLHKSVAQDYQNLMAKMQGAKDQEAFSKLMEETGINYKEGMSGTELEKNINAHFDKRIADGPGIANYMLGNRAASGAMLGVAGASVLALSDSRGRRSNSDLYSSQI